jgi:hypothetical protein
VRIVAPIARNVVRPARPTRFSAHAVGPEKRVKMAPNRVPESRFSGEPDSITRIEIAQEAATAIRVTIHSRDSEPQHFEFATMADAVRFYEEVWSQRSGGNEERLRKAGHGGGK